MSAIIDRTFPVIKVMTYLGIPASLALTTVESRLPKTTVYWIFQSLRALGYVHLAGPLGSYQLTERLVSLRQNDRSLGAREWAPPPIRRLHRTFKEIVKLGLIEGPFITYPTSWRSPNRCAGSSSRVGATPSTPRLWKGLPSPNFRFPVNTPY